MPPPRDAVLIPPAMIRAAYLEPVGARLRALNWKRDPWPGALLWPVEACTNTPKATYTDDTYSQSHGPSVTADADGFFPLLHAPEGSICDLILTTPEGMPLLRFEAGPASDAPEGAAS